MLRNCSDVMSWANARAMFHWRLKLKGNNMADVRAISRNYGWEFRDMHVQIKKKVSRPIVPLRLQFHFMLDGFNLHHVVRGIGIDTSAIKAVCSWSNGRNLLLARYARFWQR